MRITAKLAACAAAVATLSGCVALDLANLVYVVANQNGYSADAEIKPRPGKHVYTETFHTENAYGDICYADGVVVDYSVGTGAAASGHTRFDSENIYGQAVVFYKEQCGIDENAKIYDVVLTGSRRQVFGDPLKMESREKIVAYDYYANNGANRPDWMPQVMETIQAQAAAGDEDAKRFLGFVRIVDGEPVLANMPADTQAKQQEKTPEQH